MIIWERQKAAGWYNAKLLCFARIGRPVNESVTSDCDKRELKSKATKIAPDLMKMPDESLGAL